MYDQLNYKLFKHLQIKLQLLKYKNLFENSQHLN